MLICFPYCCKQRRARGGAAWPPPGAQLAGRHASNKVLLSHSPIPLPRPLGKYEQGAEEQLNVVFVPLRTPESVAK